MKGEVVIESFGGFLKKVAGFLTGSGTPPPSGGGTFDMGRTESGSDPVADSYSAMALKSALATTYSKLDTILETIKRMGGDMPAARSEVSGIVSFIQDAYRKVEEIINDPRNIPTAQRGRTLTEISKKLNQYTTAGGIIDKWRAKWMGEFNQNLSGFEFYQKGKQLAASAESLLSEVERHRTLKKEIKQTEIQNVIKRAADQVQGRSDVQDDKPQKPSKKKRSSPPGVKPTLSFSSKDPKAVQLLRQRLEKLNIKDFGSGDKLNDKDLEAASRGMKFLGTISGKEYGNSEADIKEFFQDLGIFLKNRTSVLK